MLCWEGIWPKDGVPSFLLRFSNVLGNWGRRIASLLHFFSTWPFRFIFRVPTGKECLFSNLQSLQFKSISFIIEMETVLAFEKINFFLVVLL